MYSSNYLNWTHSTTLKADDTTAQTIDLIRSSTNQNVSLLDFNGDGLTDMLFDQYSGSVTYYGVFLNNGNLGTT